MQTLTAPASVAKRKQACSSCRHRKKRCDGIRPSCSLCRKWGIQCEYGAPPPNRPEEPSMYSFPGPLFPAAPNFPMGLEGISDMSALPPLETNDEIAIDPALLNEQPFGCPTPPVSDLVPPPVDIGFNPEEDLLPHTRLPPDKILLELVQLFIENAYHYYPCFHKQTLLEEVQSRKLQTECPLVLFAICTIAARYHYDFNIRARQAEWYDLAKQLYEESTRYPDYPVRLLQAAICVMSHANNSGDFSTAWLILGKAWRQICALGFNRLDSTDDTVYGLPQKRPHSDLGKEELRRTLWLLFVVDRNFTWPVGWPHAMDERHIMVNIPIAEQLFQSLTAGSTLDPTMTVPFSRRLNTLILSRPKPAEPINVFHHLVIAHVLLGRITETMHSVHATPNSQEFAEECEELDSYLGKLWLSVPRAATSLLDVQTEDQSQSIWLSLTLNLMAIILHFRSARGADEEVATDQFARALLAAKNIVKTIKDASKISMDLVVSPHLGSTLYLAACVYIIQWRMTGDESLKDDIDLLDVVFDRYNETFVFTGHKFKIALEHDVQRSVEDIEKLKAAGLRGLLADCSKWGYVQDVVASKGISVNIT
ncbi:hypothetical protein BU24DRAFT_424533 [Aaosphaeria arxii CBS 175.79]|uniref:Zn(2)-C6 fungal-type domain-containing protein n=1 Tax=Aaosphaeria arxii CBS 175.79 TaxID=1450172 RepID=A0A6A5XLB0_9PLEO|nr:uncharacterized protein BU24DRAFT_424533 [Aaosphaeria arxii CBS 175.79]KAF2013530.1 hypothetical protein BU24DRAFT_424533 [Aaosphaeria arxii CBS 175.79]